MGAKYVNVDRKTVLLLPPDLREWVKDNALVHLVVDAVELCEVRRAKVQAVTNAEPSALIVHTSLSGHATDRRELWPTVRSIDPRLPVPQTVLVDAGYDNQAQISALQARGVTVYCPLQRKPVPHSGYRLTKHRRRLAQLREARRAQARPSTPGSTTSNPSSTSSKTSWASASSFCADSLKSPSSGNSSLSPSTAANSPASARPDRGQRSYQTHLWLL